MNDVGTPDLEARIEKLEETVFELKEELRTVRAAPPERALRRPSASNEPTVSTVTAVRSERDTRPAEFERSASAADRRASSYWDSGEWLKFLGGAMLLLGVGFLFKYSVDRGWLNPTVRVALGYALGLLLLLMGARFVPERRVFARVVSGIGIAALYITTYAQSQVFQLSTHPTAFLTMVAIAAVSIGLSVRHDESSHAVIATVGALATPFVLSTGSRDFAGLILYICIVLAGATALGWRRRWRFLKWAAALFGWVALSVAVWAATDSTATQADRVVVQLGLVVGAVLIWAVSVVRELVLPEDETPPKLEPHAFAVSTPWVFGLLSGVLWTWDEVDFGRASLVAAVVWSAASLFCRRRVRTDVLANTHAVVAAVLLAFTSTLLLEGESQLIALAVEAALIVVMARHRRADSLENTGHTLFFVVGCMMLVRLVGAPFEPPIVNLPALADLAVLALMVSSTRGLSPRARAPYALMSYAFFLTWVLREFRDYPNGPALVTVAWLVISALLLLVGLRLDRPLLRRTAMATFVLIALKLVLVDLAQIDAIVRVLTFMGFGATLLVLNYFVPNLLRVSHRDEPGVCRTPPQVTATFRLKNDSR